jgi:hypothetical protein
MKPSRKIINEHYLGFAGLAVLGLYLAGLRLRVHWLEAAAGAIFGLGVFAFLLLVAFAGYIITRDRIREKKNHRSK